MIGCPHGNVKSIFPILLKQSKNFSNSFLSAWFTQTDSLVVIAPKSSTVGVPDA